MLKFQIIFLSSDSGVFSSNVTFVYLWWPPLQTCTKNISMAFHYVQEVLQEFYACCLQDRHLNEWALQRGCGSYYLPGIASGYPVSLHPTGRPRHMWPFRIPNGLLRPRAAMSRKSSLPRPPICVGLAILPSVCSFCALLRFLRKPEKRREKVNSVGSLRLGGICNS